jgi:hypothetical protein
MGPAVCEESDARISRYVDALVGVIGHADRAGPLRGYCTGLMLACERKSVEPLAAVTAPARTAAQHQSLLHFVGRASWSDEKVLAKMCESVLPAIESRGGMHDHPLGGRRRQRPVRLDCRLEPVWTKRVGRRGEKFSSSLKGLNGAA